MLAPSLLHFFVPLPQIIKYDFNEMDLSFKKRKDLIMKEILNGLIGVKYESVALVLQKQNDMAFPLKYMEYYRKQYGERNIL